MELERDADTGEEIIHFVRRKIDVLYLRDAETKRFIKRLEHVELRVFMVVDYNVARARKGNPLYIDAGAYSLLKPSEFPKREIWEYLLEKGLESKVKEEFGRYVAKDLLELAGIEYSSVLKVEEKIEDFAYHHVKVWKHKPEDRGQVSEGTGRI